jgi:hypothetical protein
MIFYSDEAHFCSHTGRMAIKWNEIRVKKHRASRSEIVMKAVLTFSLYYIVK